METLTVPKFVCVKSTTDFKSLAQLGDTLDGDVVIEDGKDYIKVTECHTKNFSKNEIVPVRGSLWHWEIAELGSNHVQPASI